MNMNTKHHTAEPSVLKRGWFKRTLIGTLLPPILGPLILMVASFTSEPAVPTSADMAAWLLATIMAFGLVGIQAAVSALCMEFVINPRIANDRLIYAIGCVFGVLSTFVFWSGEGQILLITCTGGAVGVIMAWLLRRMYKTAHPLEAVRP